VPWSQAFRTLQTDDAQAYGRGFGYNIDEARRALGD
jgi:hypothetical protein